MAATGATPISLYYSSTAGVSPTAGNLVNGELALNTQDGKLFYKDSAGVVQVIATKGTGTIGGSNTQVQYNSSGAFAGSSNFVWDNSNTRLGIGTASPSATLDVVGSINASGDVTGLGLLGTSALIGPSSSKLFLRNVASTNRIDSYNYPITATYPFLINASTFTVAISDTDKFIVNSSGNVGIGTSSPVTGLSVSKSSGFIQLTDGTIDYRSFVWTGNAAAAVGTWSNHPLLFNTNNAERMRIDSSGNVGIGTSSPSAKLVIDGGTSIDQFRLGTGPNYYKIGRESVSNGYLNFYGTQTGATGYVFGGIDGERMRIDSSGNLLKGVTTAYSTAYGTGDISFYSKNAGFVTLAPGATGGGVPTIQVYLNAAGTAVGYIAVSTSATFFTSLSDYRVKKDVIPMQGGLEKISKLKPVTYKLKSDGSDGEGFIAHELQEVIPFAVIGKKDDVAENGEIKPQAIDQSKIVATLVLAIQELKAEVDALKAKA